MTLTVCSSILPILIFCSTCLASGGVVKLKTDGGPDGYYYNALGVEAGRFVSLYDPSDLDLGAQICSTQVRNMDQSQITPGFDDYTLFHDIRREDPNSPGYAFLRSGGLLANADVNSLQSCSTSGAISTVTFGGGAGVPDPQIRFFLTAVQPQNRNPQDPSDFCGILLDTTSNFVNSARTQSVQAGGAKQTIGFNHFLEAIVFEPRLIDLRVRFSGSRRFPGDPGIKVMFARRSCLLNMPTCRIDGSDNTIGVKTTDDYITARFTVDNNMPAPMVLGLRIEADRGPLTGQPPTDATSFFRPIGGGPPLQNPIVFPPGRTFFNLEVRTVFKRPLIGLFPVNVPWLVKLLEPNDITLFDSEEDVLGLRPFAGFYDDGTAEVFSVPRIPVLTGDAICSRYAATDLPKPGADLTIDSFQIVGGTFGPNNLPGLPQVELRTEDPILSLNPDLSPQGLVRRAVGPFPFGRPPSTIDIDITDLQNRATSIETAPHYWLLAFLNPGDTTPQFGMGGTGMTAIGGDTDGDTQVDENSFTKPGDGGTPVDPECDTNYLMRADTDPPAGNPFRSLRGRTHHPTPLLRAAGTYVRVERDRNN